MTIGTWVKQDARDSGEGDSGLSSAEREELQRLRRENRGSSSHTYPSGT